MVKYFEKLLIFFKIVWNKLFHFKSFSKRTSNALVTNIQTKGTVKWFNRIKGYGFATTPVGEVFLHVTECVDHEHLQPGIRVSMDLVKTLKGYQGVNIRVYGNQSRRDSNAR